MKTGEAGSGDGEDGQARVCPVPRAAAQGPGTADSRLAVGGERRWRL